MPEQIPPADVIEAVEKIEDFLSKSDAPANRVSVSKEAPMSSVNVSEIDQLEQRQAEIYNAEVKRLDAARAALPETERSKWKGESESQIKNRLMIQDAQFKANAGRLVALYRAGAPTSKVEKAYEPVLSQGVVADLIDQEVDRLAGVSKSDPTYHQKRARVWAENPHLRKRYEEHRGSI